MMVTLTWIPNPFQPEKSDSAIVSPDSLLGLVEHLPESMQRAVDDGLKCWVNQQEIERGDWGEFTTLGGESVGFAVAPRGIVETIQVIALLASIASAATASDRIKDAQEDAEARGDERSQNYAFSGLQNNRSEGLPIEVPFGKFRMAPTVIGSYVESTSFPEPVSTLHLLLSFGWGPIQSIAGITEDTPAGQTISAGSLGTLLEIEGNPAENYEGIRAQIRLGGNTQDPILGFSQVRVPEAVADFAMNSPESASSDNMQFAAGFDPANQFDSTNDAYWATYGRSYDVTEISNQVIIRLRFPQGCFRYGSNGEVLAAGFWWQIRYQELDDTLNPIGPSVWLPVAGQVFFTQQGLFDYEIRSTLFDPASYTAGVLGKALAITPAGNGVSFEFQTGPVAAGFPVPRLTQTVWVKIDSLPASPAVGDVVWIAGNYADVAKRGWGICYVRRSVTFFGITQERWSLTGVYGAEGARREVFDPQVPQDQNITAAWHLYTITWETDKGVRIYLDDDFQAQYQLVLGRTPEWSDANLHVGENPTYNPGGAILNGLVDQLQIFEANYGAPVISSIYEGGQGSNADFGGNVSRHTFNDTAAAQSSPFVTPWYGEPVAGDLNANSSSGSADGLIRDGGTSNPRAMRARISIVRVNVDSTHQDVVDDATWIEVQRVRDAELEHPQMPLLALEIPASEQLNRNNVQVTCVGEYLLGSVWDGLSTTSPTFTKQYTRTPPWIIIEILLNDSWGQGRRYSASSIRDIEAWGEWAAYCEEIAYDGGFVVNYQTGTLFDNVLFRNDTVDPDTGQLRGHLEFKFQGTSGTGIRGPLPDWAVTGRYVRAAGFPVVNNDINFGPSEGGGYEIFEITQTTNQSSWIVKGYWDRLNEADPWPSNTNLSNNAPGGNSSFAGATVEGGEPRHQFGGVFDTSRDLWDQLQRVAAVGRAKLQRVGQRIGVTWSRPRSVTAMVTPGSIIPGSFSYAYSDPREAPNALDLTIHDQDRRFERRAVTTAPDVSTFVQSGGILNREQRQLFGVTSAGQAKRQGRYEILVGEKIIMGGQFDSGPTTLPVESGDLIQISSDLLPRGQAGRVGSASAGDPQDLLLDMDNMASGNWTSAGATASAAGTDILGQPAFSISDASSSILGRYSQATQANFGDTLGTGQALAHGIYGASALVAPSSSSIFRLDLLLAGGTARFAVFDLVSGRAILEGGSQDGGAAIQQIGSGDDFLVRVWGAFLADSVLDNLTWSISPAVGVGGEDLTQTGAVIVSQPSITKGRHACLPLSADRTLVIGRKVTIAGTELAYIRDAQLRLGSALLDDTITQVGDFEAGSLLVLDVAATDAEGLVVIAGPDSEFILVEPGSELRAEVVSTELREDLSRRIEWVEYDPDVYNDRADSGTSPIPIVGTGGGDEPDEGEPDLRRMPLPALVSTVEDRIVLAPSGTAEHRLRVTWELEESDVGRIAATKVWVRVVTENTYSDWALMGETRGGATTLDGVLPIGGARDWIEVAVQTIAKSGQFRLPGRSGRKRAQLFGLQATRPSAPTSFRVEMVGDKVRYDWTFAAGEEGNVLEVRRGAWILGSPVFTSSPGQTAWGPSDDWAGSSDTTAKLYIRARNQIGAYSEVTVENFEPTPAVDPAPPALQDLDRAWESYTGGDWEAAIPAVGDPQIGPEFEQAAGGELQYTAASTSVADVVAFTSAENRDLIADAAGARTFRQSRLVYIEAYMEAEYVYPGAATPAADPSTDFRRWTTEGPLELLEGEAMGRVYIQIRINETGVNADWGNWQLYRPGLYRVVEVQFRIRAQRPATDHNVKIHKFHTRITAPRQSMEWRTPARAMLEGGALG